MKTTTVKLSKQHSEKLSKIAFIVRENKQALIEEMVDAFYSELIRELKAQTLTQLIFKEFLYRFRVKIITFLKNSETDKAFKKQLLKHGIAVMAVDNDKLWEKEVKEK